MTPAGRPRGFDRDQARLAAARLFWRTGYDGTSVAALTAAMGVSPSSLYAAFGDKAGLFRETVETYAGRYAGIYRNALAEESSIRDAVERILRKSAKEFTRTDDQHPGCLASSAAMHGGSGTFDVREHVRRMQEENEYALRSSLQDAVRSGELPEGSDPARLARYVQAVWHGLSHQAGDGATLLDLEAVVSIAMTAWPGAAD